jgi:hypothetical protein
MCIPEITHSSVDGKLTVADCGNSKTMHPVDEDDSPFCQDKQGSDFDKIFSSAASIGASADGDDSPFCQDKQGSEFDKIFSSAASIGASVDFNNKTENRKVTFDLKPDFENEERGFCRRRTRSIVIDAMSIYSKYISLEATHPFGLDEPLRRQVEGELDFPNT